jgi:hypothetical protein
MSEIAMLQQLTKGDTTAEVLRVVWLAEGDSD